MKRGFALVVTWALAATLSLAASSYIAYRAPWRLTLVELLALAGFAVVTFVTLRWVERRFAWIAGLWLVMGLAAALVSKIHAADRVPSVWTALDDSPRIAEPIRTALRSGRSDAARTLLFDAFHAAPARDADTFEPTPAADSAVAEEWMTGRVHLGRGRAFDVPSDLDWSEDPEVRADFPFELHAMSYVSALARRHRATGDPRYLERAEELVFDWIDDNQRDFWRIGPPSAKGSWTDHTTALRLRHWLVFWDAWRRSSAFSPERMEVFLAAVLAHVRLLASADFYAPGHNHGLDQDIALIAVAGVLPELEGSADWLELAVRRLDEQVRSTIWPSGVHKEHSPAYHLYVLEMLSGVERFAESNRMEPVLRLELGSLLVKMSGFLAEMVLPDRSLPVIGDTRPGELVDADRSTFLRRWADREPKLAWVLGGGRVGAPPSSRSYFDREAGYAVLRDTWSFDDRDRVHLMFTAASNPARGHKHYDDLSFTLYGMGRPLLVDSGSYQYHYESDGRKFVVSPQAHNTVVVDDGEFVGGDPVSRNWRSPDPAGHATRLEAGSDDGEVATLSASHENWPGIRFERSLFYFRPRHLVVVDRLVPTGDEPRPRVFEQLWHLDSGARVELGEDGGPATIGGGATGEPDLRISQWHAGRGTFRVVQGQRRPMQGWVTDYATELVEAPVLISRAEGESALFVTTIAIGEGRPADGAAWRGREENGALLLESSTGPATKLSVRVPFAGDEPVSWSRAPR